MLALLPLLGCVTDLVTFTIIRRAFEELGQQDETAANEERAWASRPPPEPARGQEDDDLSNVTSTQHCPLSPPLGSAVTGPEAWRAAP